VGILTDRLQGGDLAARLEDLHLLGRLGHVAMSAVPAVVRAMMSRDAGENIGFFLNDFLPPQRAWHYWEFDRKILDSGERCQSPSNLRGQGAAVLGRIGPEANQQAVSILTGMLRGDDEAQRLQLRAYAADGLGAFGPAVGVAAPVLRNARSDGVGFVRDAAEKALEAVEPSEAGGGED
jgi:hypothetical protein